MFLILSFSVITSISNLVCTPNLATTVKVLAGSIAMGNKGTWRNIHYTVCKGISTVNTVSQTMLLGWEGAQGCDSSPSDSHLSKLGIVQPQQSSVPVSRLGFGVAGLLTSEIMWHGNDTWCLSTGLRHWMPGGAGPKGENRWKSLLLLSIEMVLCCFCRAVVGLSFSLGLCLSLSWFFSLCPQFRPTSTRLEDQCSPLVQSWIWAKMV